MKSQIKFISTRVARGLLTIITLLSLFIGSAQAQTTNTTDGTTLPGIAPGAPAGSYPLTDIEVLNIYNGNVSLNIPLLKMGGRGSVLHTLAPPTKERFKEQNYRADLEPQKLKGC